MDNDAHWPPSKVSEVDVLSVSTSSKRMEELWVIRSFEVSIKYPFSHFPFSHFPIFQLASVFVHMISVTEPSVTCLTSGMTKKICLTVTLSALGQYR